MKTSMFLEALRGGVKAYVLKSQAAEDLVRAIQKVCRGSVYLSPSISRVTVGMTYLRCTYPPILFQGERVRFFNW
jgi:DNA-binding NarL/FixJ family response regulator